MPAKRTYRYTPLDWTAPPPLNEILFGPDPRWFMEAFIKIPSQDGLVPFKLYPWMHEVADPANGGIGKRHLMLKAREVGSSTFWIAEKIRKVLINPGSNLLIAANIEGNAKNLIAYARAMVLALPPEFGVKVGRFNQTEIELDFGPRGISLIKALPGTSAAGRSDRARYIVGTEVAYWGANGKVNPEEYLLSVLGTLSGAAQDGEVVLESTAYTSADMFHEMWYDTANGYQKSFYGVWDNPSHTDEWYAQRRAEIKDTFLFLRDYPETPEQAFSSAADTYFDPPVIVAGQAMVREPIETKPVESEGRDPGYIKYWQKVLPGRTYAIGVDPSEGLLSSRGKPDWSAAYVIDVRASTVVAALYCRLNDIDLATQVVLLAREYNQAFTLVERNNPGLAVIRNINNIGYTNLYKDRKPVANSFGTEYVDEPGFRTTRASKSVLLSDLHQALRSGFTVPDASFWDEAKNLGRASMAALSGHDDRVMALALTYMAAINYQRPIQPATGLVNRIKKTPILDFPWSKRSK